MKYAVLKYFFLKIPKYFLTRLCVSGRSRERIQNSQSGASSLHYRGIFSAHNIFAEHNIFRVVVRKARLEAGGSREKVGGMDALMRRRWLTVVVYAATNICLSTQRGSRYHPALSLVRAANDMHSRGRNGRYGRYTATKRIIKGPD